MFCGKINLFCGRFRIILRLGGRGGGGGEKCWKKGYKGLGGGKFRPFRLIVRERAVYGAYWYDDFGLFGQEMGARDGRERMVGFALLCDYIFILDIVFLFHDSR